MTIAEFRYHRPATIAEACDLADRLGPGAAFLAGGTELIPDYQRGRETAQHLISLVQIAEIRGIRRDGDELRVGALTTVADVERSSLVRDQVPALAQAAAALGSPPIRSLATIGGNFCRAVACADLPPAAIASGARLRLVTATSSREVDAAQFFVDARRTVLARGELLAEVIFPAQPRPSGATYQRFAHRRGAALAVASVAVRLSLSGDRIEEARIALGAVAPVPRLARRAGDSLAGARPTPDAFARAADACVGEARPISDIRGTAEFRRELVRVLTLRALEEALVRARDSA